MNSSRREVINSKEAMDQVGREIQECVDSRINVVKETMVDGTLANIPVLGNYLVALRSNLHLQKVEERLNLFADKLKHYGVQRLPEDFYYSDEGYDLLNKTCEQIIRTNSETKMKNFARIIQGVLNETEITYIQADIYLNVVAQATDEEMLVLVLLKKNGFAEEFTVDQVGELSSLMKQSGVPLKRHYYIIKRLESMGLLMIPNTVAAGGMVFAFTEIAHEVIEFLYIK